MKRSSIVFLISSALMLGTGHILQKAVLEYGVNRYVFAFLRISFGFFIISMLVIKRRKNPVKIIRANYRHFIILGIIFSGCGILLKLWGLQHTTATNASFIMALSSVNAIIFGYFFLKERVSRGFYLIVLVMISGIYLITTKGDYLIPRKGDLIILFLSILIGSMQVYGKNVLKNLSVIETAFGRSLFGMVFLGLMIPLFAGNGFSTIPSIWVLVLVLSNGLTFSLSILFFYKALSTEGVSNSGMFALLSPVFTTILGYIFLNERLTILQIFGGIIILSGSFLISRQRVFTLKE